MADSVKVGSLVVTITGDTADLQKAAGQVRKSLDQVTKDAQAAGRGVATSFTDMARSLLPVVSAVAAVTAAVKAFQNEMANVTALDHLSQATGISIQSLSELRGVALQLGIDFETLSRAVAQFGPRMTEALAQPASRGSQALRALGIDVRDAQGNIRSLVF